MLTFHPKPGTLLICDFDRGFKAPEMVKKRPVVVISPRRRKSTPQLCTVVPLSSSAPNPVEHGTAQSPQLLQAGDGRGRPGAGVRGRPRLSGRKTRHPAPPVIDTEHDPLAESIEANGLSVESLADYLQVFRYGCPPHGGFAIGLERLTQKVLGLESVKEASLFPRDRKRTRP